MTVDNLKIKSRRQSFDCLKSEQRWFFENLEKDRAIDMINKNICKISRIFFVVDLIVIDANLKEEKMYNNSKIEFDSLIWRFKS